MPDLVGQLLLKRYRVETLVGSGGMAEVYKVWDEERAVYIAIKILHPDKSATLKSFLQEAEVLKRLDHPHIVRFYDYENDRDLDLSFLVMDYIDGTTLRDMIVERKRPFSPLELLHYIEPVATGLNYAHIKTIYHLDVKPSNILMDKDGKVFVSDFGISKIGAGEASRGTPSHMAPEQILGERVDARTDIYGLGVTLFELVTGGKRPFAGDSPSSASSGTTTRERLEWEHVHQPTPSPRSYNPGLTVAFEQIVMRCLNKDPHQRYDSTLELLQSLKEAIQSPDLMAAIPYSPDKTVPISPHQRDVPLRTPSEPLPIKTTRDTFRTDFYLEVRSGPNAGQIVPLARDSLTVGRSRDCDLSLPSRHVSRRHAMIRKSKSYYYIQDLGSTDGTWINGQRITQATVIYPDAVIRLADVELVFRQRRKT
jgi:serine/threonine protein kinase